MSVDASFQFVDTNILIYAHDNSAGEKHRLAVELLDSLWNNHTGCLSVQVLQEFYVTITRKVKHPLPSAIASQIINDLSAWEIHSPTALDVITAIALHQRYNIAFWDAMILQSAQCLGCQVVWSEDLNPEQTYNGVSIANPFLEISHPG